MSSTHTCHCVLVLFMIFHIRIIQGQIQNFDGLMGKIHQQGELLTILTEKVEELTKTVHELRFKNGEQEQTIEKLSVKTATQNSEIQVLRDSINSMKEYSGANFINRQTKELGNKGNSSNNAKTMMSTKTQKAHNLKNEENQRSSTRELRLLSQSIPDNELDNQCAFYAYMSKDENTLAPHHTLIFDVVKTNIGDSYNKFTGVFTVPSNGLYVLTWNIYSDALSYAFSNLVVNQNIWNSALANSANNGDRHASTGIVVAHLNKGDVVFVKTHENQPGRGNIESSSEARSTFSGWRIN